MKSAQSQPQSRFAKVHLPAGGNSNNVGETFACHGLTCKRGEKIKKTQSFFPSWLNCIVAPFRRLWRLFVRHPGNPVPHPPPTSYAANTGGSAEGKIRAEAASYRRMYFQKICVDALRIHARIANEESQKPVMEERFVELLDHIVANFEVDFEEKFAKLLNENPSAFISAALYDAYTSVNFRSDIHESEFEILSAALDTYVGPDMKAYIAEVSGIIRQDPVRLNRVPPFPH